MKMAFRSKEDLSLDQGEGWVWEIVATWWGVGGCKGNSTFKEVPSYSWNKKVWGMFGG